MDKKEILEKSEGIIAGYAKIIGSAVYYLEQYFAGQEVSLYGVRMIGEACSLRKDSEGIEMVLHVHLKNGGNRKVVEDLERVIAKFFELADKHIEYGDEYKSFDIPTIFDKLFVEMLKEKTELISRRIAKIDSDCEWITDSINITAINNSENYEMDEIDDAEKENGYRSDRIFDNLEHIQRIASFMADYREARELCWTYGLHSLVELLSLIEERIKRYSSELSPAEYVKEKYRKAVEAGEFIFESDYELRDWECQDFRLREEIDSMVAESFSVEDDAVEDEESATNYQSQGQHKSDHPRREYFSWQKVNHIHEICNGNQFDDVTIGEMYSIINLHDCTKSLICQEGELERVCHLIYVLGEQMPKTHGRIWRRSMCEHLNITPRSYNKNYKKVSSGTSKNHEIFEKKIDVMLKKFEEIDEAA